MTDKKDGPGQKDGPAKAGDRGATDSAAKRPHATIDLKAVEVPPAAPSTGPVPPKAAEPPSPKAPQAATPRNQAEAARKVAAAAQASAAGSSAPQSGSPSAVKPSPAGATTATASAAATSAAASGGRGAPPPAVSGKQASGGIGRYLLSGVAGGVLALLAAPLISPIASHLWEEAGVPPPVASLPPEVVQRLAALEKKAAAPVAPASPENDPARANAAAEANRKRIEALQAQLAAVGEMQARALKLAGDLEQRLSKEPPIADVGERLVALERQLNELGAAARTEPDRAGRIPQLAAMTGRIADLEAALVARAGELRKDAAREIETRIAPVSEAGEAARSATQRIDRELGTLKGETNRLATGLDKVKTDTERLQLALKAAGDDTAKLAGSVDGVRRELESRIASMAKPDDVTAAVSPLVSKLGALERNLTTVVQSEGERNATAERIVLSLELGNLKRAMERGVPYDRELAEVAKVSGTRIDLRPLEAYRKKGVPTLSELASSFRPVAHAILDADSEKSDGSVVDRLLSGAKTFVRVRKTTHASGDSTPEAIVARIEDALRAGRLGDVVAEAKSLERPPEIAKEWIATVEARQAVDSALKSIDEALKASLGAGPAASPAPAAQKKGQP
jgi:hypothetical protein